MLQVSPLFPENVQPKYVALHNYHLIFYWGKAFLSNLGRLKEINLSTGVPVKIIFSFKLFYFTLKTKT